MMGRLPVMVVTGLELGIVKLKGMKALGWFGSRRSRFQLWVSHEWMGEQTTT